MCVCKKGLVWEHVMLGCMCEKGLVLGARCSSISYACSDRWTWESLTIDIDLYSTGTKTPYLVVASRTVAHLAYIHGRSWEKQTVSLNQVCAGVCLRCCVGGWGGKAVTGNWGWVA